MKNVCFGNLGRKVQMLRILLMIVLSLSICTTHASAFATPGRSNTGTIAIQSSTGTIPGGSAKMYTAMDGDELVYSIILGHLLSPDYLDIEFGQGIEFQNIKADSVYNGSPFEKIDWKVTGIEQVREGTVRIDLSDLPDQVEQLIFTMECRVSSQLAAIYEGSSVKAILSSKGDETRQEFVSPKVYGLHMGIKTVDTSTDEIESGVTHGLYYDCDALTAVAFLKKGSVYTACPDTDPNAVYDLKSESGAISLEGLREGKYYLSQVRISKDGREDKAVVPVYLTGDVKFDPNDPSNKVSKKEKEQKDADSQMSEKTRKALEEIKKQKEMEEAARYHAEHPREFVSAVKLGRNASCFVSVNTTESAADLVWDCSQRAWISYNVALIADSPLGRFVLIVGFFIILCMIISGIKEGILQKKMKKGICRQGTAGVAEALDGETANTAHPPAAA